MPQGEDGVAPEHPWTREPHDVPNLLAFAGSIAVDRAVGAGGLVFAEYAAAEPDAGVIQQAATIPAKPLVMAVPRSAIDAKHGRHRSVLAAEAWVDELHP